MSNINGVAVFKKTEIARQCGVTRQAMEQFLAKHPHMQPAYIIKEPNHVTRYYWTPEQVADILEMWDLR